MRLARVRFDPTSTAPAILAANARISRLARQGDMAGARAVFDSMPCRNVVSFNALLSGYFSNSLPDPALHLFSRIPTPNLSSFNALISGLVRSGRLSTARSVLFSMPVPPSAISYTSLLRGYIQVNQISEAETLFRLMPEKNVISYTVMLGGLIQDNRIDDARKLFNEMPEKDVVAWTRMLSGYCQIGRIREARELFDQMPERNLVSWTAMVSGYVRNSMVDVARKLFEVMPERNEVTWTAMLVGYTQVGRVSEAEELFRVMPDRPVLASNHMILGFGVQGLVDIARVVFEQIGASRDEGSWNAMIKVYERNECHMAALYTFRDMLTSGVRPNHQSVISALTVYASLATSNHGRDMHGIILRFSLYNDVFVMSALITMYIKCGDLVKAKLIFDRFEPKDTVMWNSMITGYAQHGLGEDALNMFDKMLHGKIKPDEVAYVGVLSACAYTGKVKEGREIFESMLLNPSVRPGCEHYACMVDLLGRVGLIEEAMDLVRNMPMEPDAVVWGALLGACKMHKNVEIAELAVKNLVQLEPGNAGPYILLSHIYASAGRWRESTDLRKHLASISVSKPPGCSWIESGRRVHLFTSGDFSAHPDHALIATALLKLEGLLRLVGYSPDSSFVLHDLDEEQKASELMWHSEKQAVAFGLMNGPEGLTIRVMKNLRVCGDCHSFIKLITKVTGREVVLRDANRFHRFKDGACSCRDFW